MRIKNKKVGFKYQIFETLEAGVTLKGDEVKAVRKKGVDLTAAYAKVLGGEVYLINAKIAASGSAVKEPARTRKLLLKKEEIEKISSRLKAKSLTLVPLSVYTSGRLIKVELALAKTKKRFEKRQDIKKRDIEREIKRALKGTT